MLDDLNRIEAKMEDFSIKSSEIVSMMNLAIDNKMNVTDYQKT